MKDRFYFVSQFGACVLSSCPTRAAVAAGGGGLRLCKFCVYRYGEPLYIILYLFGVAIALGMASILAGVLANSEASDPVKMKEEFYLARARYINHRARYSGCVTKPLL